ncbi:unnamed protein product [Rhizophagus irregularis]|nr:unnamed protein product [Rhizophagus irregularis]
MKNTRYYAFGSAFGSWALDTDFFQFLGVWIYIGFDFWFEYMGFDFRLGFGYMDKFQLSSLTFDWTLDIWVSTFGWALDIWISAFGSWILDIWISAFSYWALDIWISAFGSWVWIYGFRLSVLGLWIGRRTVQIVHFNFDDFFGNDRPKLDQLLSDIRQFEIWTKWTILTSALYNDYIEEINADSIDLLGSSIDDEESEISDEEELFEDDDKQDEYRPNWMFFAEMGPKPNFDCSSDLDSQDIDQNYNWINDPRELYTDLIDIDPFLSRNPKIGEKNVLMNYQILNDNQKIIFERIKSHYHDTLKGYKDEPLKIIVMGTAGTRKTYLIEAIRSKLREMAGGSKAPIARSDRSCGLQH